jgi:hypothetical protein
MMHKLVVAGMFAFMLSIIAWDAHAITLQPHIALPQSKTHSLVEQAGCKTRGPLCPRGFRKYRYSCVRCVGK